MNLHRARAATLFAIVVVEVEIGQAIACKSDHFGRIFIGHLGVANVKEQIEIWMINFVQKLDGGSHC